MRNVIFNKFGIMNNYETVLILNPVLSEDQVKESIDKFKNLLSSFKAELVSSELWGLKKMKYLIQNKKTGFYVLCEFKSKPDIIANLEVELTRDERIVIKTNPTGADADDDFGFTTTITSFTDSKRYNPVSDTDE